MLMCKIVKLFGEKGTIKLDSSTRKTSKMWS